MFMHASPLALDRLILGQLRCIASWTSGQDAQRSGTQSAFHLIWTADAAFSRPIDQAVGNFPDPCVRHAITLVAWADDDFLIVRSRACPVIRPGAHWLPEIILSLWVFATVPD